MTYKNQFTTGICRYNEPKNNTERRRLGMATAETMAYCSSVLQILGQNVRRVREMRQYSYLDLARISGYNRQYLAALEAGKKDLQLGTAVKIARALNVPFSKLFSRAFDGEEVESEVGFTDDDFLLVFSTKVRRYLAAQGKEEIHIYMETGVDPATVNRILNRKIANPRIFSLIKIAAGVGKDVSDLFTRAERGSEES